MKPHDLGEGGRCARGGLACLFSKDGYLLSTLFARMRETNATIDRMLRACVVIDRVALAVNAVIARTTQADTSSVQTAHTSAVIARTTQADTSGLQTAQTSTAIARTAQADIAVDRIGKSRWRWTRDTRCTAPPKTHPLKEGKPDAIDSICHRANPPWRTLL